jgi:hypothetical protein
VGEAGGSIRCRASDGKLAGVLVVPVRADRGWAEAAEQCTAVFVTRTGEDTGPQPTSLRALYGLTPTEAALAAIVGRGEGYRPKPVRSDANPWRVRICTGSRDSRFLDDSGECHASIHRMVDAR